MSHPFSRRSLIGAAVAVPAVIGLPAVAASAATSVKFTLNAVTLDGGEQVVSLTLHTSSIKPIDVKALKASQFSVHVSATLPAGAPGGLAFGPYEGPRKVTGVTVDNRGNIVLALESGPTAVGAGTLAYVLAGGRNWAMDLDYTITLSSPIKLKNGRTVKVDSFVQGDLVNPEVDAYSYHQVAGGLEYRLFKPTQGGGKERSTGKGHRPLVVWLHGGGEGAASGAADNNESQLRANRGALGYSTPEAQKIFKGAYVVAPQATDAWMSDGDRYAPMIKAVIDEVVAKYPIDPDQIHVLGCSNGGYMSLKMTVEYPDFFASSVPICPGAGPNFFSDAELAGITTPTWLVHSKDDDVLPWELNSGRAHALIKDSILTLYDHVIWNGHQYSGHWSWIYVAHNDPSHNGQHLWQWQAAQRA
ncbi:prolyl oligopeptidase family serine peptidase [Aestuariimicrobium ganziense]|uniref:prolyl oligopeptidase family serine peptidase n=1 Tax=Aestuariimicrobium ganziense TaxID=2773677 RepID=UPI001940EBA4|nr:PHB depolymerase family esterase [Aestuariimicrobium ganziense]